jgi:hypothetical protein
MIAVLLAALAGKAVEMDRSIGRSAAQTAVSLIEVPGGHRNDLITLLDSASYQKGFARRRGRLAPCKISHRRVIASILAQVFLRFSHDFQAV